MIGKADRCRGIRPNGHCTGNSLGIIITKTIANNRKHVPDTATSPFQDVLWKRPGSFHRDAMTVPSEEKATELRDRTGTSVLPDPEDRVHNRQPGGNGTSDGKMLSLRIGEAGGDRARFA